MTRFAPIPPAAPTNPRPDAPRFPHRSQFAPPQPPRQPQHQPPLQAWPVPQQSQQPPLNVLALLSVVALAVCAPASIVLGLLGRRQAERRGERGRTLATIGAVAGAALTLIGTAAIVLVLASGAVHVRTYAGTYEPAAKVAAGIESTSGGRVGNVSCPQDLPGTVGATIACTGTVDGQPGTLRVTTTQVRGQAVGYHWEQVS